MERVLTDCCRAAGLTSWPTHLQRAAELHGTHVPDMYTALPSPAVSAAPPTACRTHAESEHARATGFEAGKQVRRLTLPNPNPYPNSNPSPNKFEALILTSSKQASKEES